MHYGRHVYAYRRYSWFVVSIGAIQILAVSAFASARHVQSTVAENSSLTLTTRELWRVGSEEDLLVALPMDVQVGPDGNLYVLDTKMLDIKVFTMTGQHVRTIGREGEGPGEFRRPSRIAFLPDATLSVAETYPGRLVGLRLDGKAARDVKPLAGNAADVGSIVLTGVMSGGDNVVLSGYEVVSDNERRTMQRKFFIRSYALSGAPRYTYFERESRFDFGSPKTTIREADVYRPVGRMAVDSSGRVYIAESREEYKVHVYRPDGSLEMTFGRDFETWQRNGLAKSVARNIMAASYRSIPGVQLELSDMEPDIERIRVARDGTIWIQSSRDLYQPHKGTFTSWDVFQSDGRLLRSVEIVVPGSSVFDELVIPDNGHVFVVTNLLDQVLVNAGMPSSASYIGREGEHVEIICYKIQ